MKSSGLSPTAILAGLRSFPSASTALSSSSAIPRRNRQANEDARRKAIAEHNHRANILGLASGYRSNFEAEHKRWAEHPHSKYEQHMTHINVSPAELEHQRILHSLMLKRGNFHMKSPQGLPVNHHAFDSGSSTYNKKAYLRHLRAGHAPHGGYEWSLSPPDNYLRARARNARPGIVSSGLYGMSGQYKPLSANNLRKMYEAREREHHIQEVSYVPPKLPFSVRVALFRKKHRV